MKVRARARARVRVRVRARARVRVSKTRSGRGEAPEAETAVPLAHARTRAIVTHLAAHGTLVITPTPCAVRTARPSWYSCTQYVQNAGPWGQASLCLRYVPNAGGRYAQPVRTQRR